ncbi:MAG TPA: hypothetical protein VKB39_03300 [Candidatus Baltobacteraceae bacterium]|nr:hypothetical protein [Candidatus Baltobacteraceae bacterium]
MIAYRAFLAAATAIVGTIIAIRMLAYGIRLETLPGIVLGAAMIGLGAHRLSLIVRARRSAP